jgi:hypothetical protein
MKTPPCSVRGCDCTNYSFSRHRSGERLRHLSAPSQELSFVGDPMNVEYACFGGLYYTLSHQECVEKLLKAYTESELARVRGLLQRILMAAGEISPEICECGCPKFTHNPCCLSESAEGICQCDGFRQRADVDMKRGVIYDRNGGEHKQEQTCPECASVFYDKNFATCPVCKHGMAYVVKPFCPAGKKDCPCHTFVPAAQELEAE